MLVGLLVLAASGCKPQVESTAPLFQRKFSTAEADAETLAMSVHYMFAADGTYTRTERHRYRLLTEAGVRDWGTVSAMWEPWYQDKPELAATVTRADGSKVTLDKATITARPARSYSPQVFSDVQVLQAPIPALAVGVEVEEVTTVRTTKPLPWQEVHSIALQGLVKRAAYEVVIEAPAKMKLQHAVVGTTEKAREEVSGETRRLTWTAKDLPALEFPEPGLPSDIHYWPQLVFRTHDESWRDVARKYAGFVDDALAGFEPPPVAKEIAGAKAAREQKIEGLLEWVHDRVRYTGMELGTGTVLPTAPAQVLARGYGDCKDQATLLVGLLRAAGIEAHVVLLRAGLGADVATDFPGISEFNHAIVVVPGREPLWIDPTAEYARAGQLPSEDRGRQVLIAARDSQGLVMTPRARADDNTYVETRTVTLAGLGKAKVREESAGTGTIELSLRESLVGSRKDLEEGLGKYVEEEYGKGKLKSFEATPSADLVAKHKVVLNVEGAGVATTTLWDAAVSLDWGPLWRNMPSGLFPRGDDEKDKLRASPLAVTTPFDARVIYRVVPPAGYEAIVPRFDPVDLGPVLLERTATRDGDAVVVTLHVRLDGERLTPEQVNKFRGGVEALDKQPGMAVVVEHRAAKAYERKDLPAALAIVAKEAKAGDAGGRLRHADVLSDAHLYAAALAEVRAVIAADANHALAHAMLADLLRVDRHGHLHGAGWDRAGAIAAGLRAAELDETLIQARVNAALDAEAGEGGTPFGEGSDLARAAEIWAKVDPDKLDTENDPGLVNNQYLGLWYLERYDELEKLVAERGAAAPWLPKRLLAWRRGGITGLVEALRADTSLSAAARSAQLRTTFHMLVGRESYANLAALLDAGPGLGITDDAQSKLVRATVRAAQNMGTTESGATGVKRLFVDLVDAAFKAKPGDVDRALEALMSTRVTDRPALLRGQRTWRGPAKKGPMPTAARFVRDMLLGASTLTVEGSEATGYRVSVGFALDNMVDKPSRLFVVREGKAYRLRATGENYVEATREALYRLTTGDTAGGKQWLKWLFEDSRKTDAHVLTQPAVVLLWHEGQVPPVLVAQTALMGSGDRDAFKAVVAARAKLKDDDPSAVHLDQAIVRAAKKADAAASTKALANLRARFPGVDALALIELIDATHAQDWKRLDGLVAAYQQRVPKAHGIQRAHARSLARRGDFAAGIAKLKELHGQGVAVDEDFNLMAWWSLFAGKGVPTEEALSWATRAAASDSPSRVHTLGCVYAAMGRTYDALRTYDRLLSMRDEPHLDDEYLLAEIHRLLGYTAEANAVYAKFTVDEGASDDGADTAVLARRRLATKDK